MTLNETTLADVLHCMAEGRTNYSEVDFEINGLKARLEIKLKSRGEEK